MIENDIVNGVAEAARVLRSKTTQALETIIEVMRRSLARGHRIELRGALVESSQPAPGQAAAAEVLKS